MKSLFYCATALLILTSCSNESKDEVLSTNKHLEEIYNKNRIEAAITLQNMVNQINSRSSSEFKTIQDVYSLSDEEFENLISQINLSNNLDEMYEYSISELSHKHTQEEVILIEEALEEYAINGFCKYEFIENNTENFSQSARETTISIAGKIDGIMPIDNGRIILFASPCRDALYVKLVEIGVASFICDEIYGMTGVSGALPDLLTCAADMTSVLAALRDYKKCNGGKW